MLACMSSAEFQGWMAFEQLEPFGAIHAEYMAGQICSVIANVQRDPKRRKEAFAGEDFMPALRAYLKEAEPAAPALEVTDEQRAAFLDAAIFGVTPPTP